ncbi:hypothetical protein CSPX01_15604 [Colletotrichum filicis]|nr:hypothetical protein CSPX01_15604 [Colletotrichum filicis]
MHLFLNFLSLPFYSFLHLLSWVLVQTILRATKRNITWGQNEHTWSWKLRVAAGLPKSACSPTSWIARHAGIPNRVSSTQLLIACLASVLLPPALSCLEDACFLRESTLRYLRRRPRSANVLQKGGFGPGQSRLRACFPTLQRENPLLLLPGPLLSTQTHHRRVAYLCLALQPY